MIPPNKKSTKAHHCGGRRENKDIRPRGEYLTPKEMDRLISVASKGANGLRDSTMILMAYRHALRATELCRLRWQHVNFEEGTIWVDRIKKSKSGLHPMLKDEVKALRALEKNRGPLKLPWIFLTRFHTAISRNWFFKTVERVGKLARIPFPVHPHMIRHSTGYKLVNDGVDIRMIQDFLGHRNIQHTVRYTELSKSRFEGMWKE